MQLKTLSIVLNPSHRIRFYFAMNSYKITSRCAWLYKSFLFLSCSIGLISLIYIFFCVLGVESLSILIFLPLVVLLMYFRSLRKTFLSNDFLLLDKYGLSFQSNKQNASYSWNEISYLFFTPANGSYCLDIYTLEEYYDGRLKKKVRDRFLNRLNLVEFDGAYIPANFKRYAEILSGRKNVFRHADLGFCKMYIAW